MMTNKEKYRAFCKEEKDIPIFSKDWWLDSVCNNGNWDVAIVEQNNLIIASMPYYITKSKGFTKIDMPLLTQTMGVYIKYPQNQSYYKKLSFEKQLIEELLKQIPKIDAYKQRFSYQFTNWLPFYWKGYKQTTRYSYCIEDLSKYNDDTFKSIFTSSYRNKLKKAEKILDIRKGLDIETFFTLNKKTFNRQGIDVPYSLEFLKNHDKHILENESREIFYAIDKESRIHSALYLTWDSNSSYVHLVGEDPNLRNSGAGILLVKEAILYTTQFLKLDVFDFEGSMLENVEQVRRSFGAKQKPYFEIMKTNSKLLKLINLFRN